jgi:DNA (cytosine-5)-methyltransferase 1
MIPSLDLFSGMGGFAYVLRDVCRPLAYCESDPICRSILQRNMNGGVIPAAPIFDDVRSLDPPSAAVVLTAGFPCQDVSVLNVHGEGLDGKKTSLFAEVMRIVHSTPSITTIILENSPMIVRKGLDRICADLVRIGFTVTWGVWSVKEVGGLHQRRRWYCLATKQSPDVRCLMNIHIPHDWSTEPCDRLVRYDGDVNARRHFRDVAHAIGNAIVPQQACLAIHSLCAALTVRGTIVPFPSKIRVDGVYTCSASDGVRMVTRHVDPGVDACVRLQFRDMHLPLASWPTPTSTQRWLCRHVSSPRSLRFYQQAVYYERTTREQAHLTDSTLRAADKVWAINPGFTLWLMGYPLDYVGVAPTPQGT